MEDNKEVKNETQGWKDVKITSEMPLSMLIEFLNVLNQRLTTAENLIPVEVEKDKYMSLTEFYAKQNEAQENKVNDNIDKKGE